MAHDEGVDPRGHWISQDQDVRAPAVHDDRAHALAVQGDVVALQDDRLVDQVQPGLQADAAALGGEGVDGRLDALAWADDHGAAAGPGVAVPALGRWRAALGHDGRGAAQAGDGGELDVVVPDAAGRGGVQDLDLRRRGPPPEHPVVAEVERAGRRECREGDLDAGLEVDRPGPRRDQTVAVDDIGGGRLVPALDAGVAQGDVRGGRAERPPGRQGAIDHDLPLVLPDVDDQGHLARLVHQLATVVSDGDPVADAEAHDLVAADPVDRQRRLRPRDGDGGHGGDDRAVVP